MSAIRGTAAVAFVILGCTGAASAHHLRWHRIAHRAVPHFVFASPDAATAASGPGFFGGTFETGILGASTADPYTAPAYGYDGHGYYGPGFAYPGY